MPTGQRATSTPLGIQAAGVMGAQEAAVKRDTAAKELQHRSSRTADSSHHRGGVCKVVSIGIGSAGMEGAEQGIETAAID